MDLVEISPTANPPVCKIIDYGKFKYEQAKKQDEARKKQKQIHIKEIKFRPNTDVGDYQVKLRSLIRFLEEGDKAKITVRFRGREMAHQDIGFDVLVWGGVDRLRFHGVDRIYLKDPTSPCYPYRYNITLRAYS